MSGIPYHAWTHRPKADGGTDPIENPRPWAAVWDNFIWGQSIDDGFQTTDVRIKMTAGVVSDNGDPYFEIVGADDPDELEQTIYTPSILKDGLYLFTLRVRHSDPGHPHFMARYFFENLSAVELAGQVVSGTAWDFVHHADAAMTDWEAIHTMSFQVPVRLENPTVGWEPWPHCLIMEFAGGAGDFDGALGFKNFYVSRLGPLVSSRSWPDDGIGVPL